MEIKTAANTLAALAQESRLSLFRLLVEAGPDGLPAGEIGERLGIPAATLSFHLKTLTQAGLLLARPEGRFIYYAADYTVMDALLAFLTQNCCQGETTCLPRTAAADTLAKRRAELPAAEAAKPSGFNVLILCTGNSARSILGEALFNHLGAGRLAAFSAGSQPAGKVNPVALETLERHGVPMPDPRSKSWDEFAAPGAPKIDFIFTVCDSAAAETCPVWPGHPFTTHWGIPDPAHVEPLEARREAFERAFWQMERRVRAFLDLPLEAMTGPEMRAAAARLHREASADEAAATA
jgi:arsenate reductase